MRTRTCVLVIALLLYAGGLAHSENLQMRISGAVARDLGISVQAVTPPFALQILGPEVRVPDEARLQVTSVHAVAGVDNWLLRMECGSRLECLPFEVLLRLRGQRPSSLPAAPAGSPSAVPVNQVAAPVVRAGQRVRLAEEVSGMRLSVTAVCLQAGVVGQRIRVRNLSSGRVVLARVRAAGQVVVED